MGGVCFEANLKIILAGASGYLGQALISFLRAANHEIILISRHDPHLDANFIEWDGATMGVWARAFDGADAVINLAGRSVNCRYNDENRRQILESRVQTTMLIGRAIGDAATPPRTWLNAASATIYRDARDRAMEEKSGEIGKGFSVDICRAWEQTLFAAPVQCCRVAMRLAMVFGAPHGGVYDAFEILVKLGFGGPMADGGQYISWIHLHDFCRAVAFLLDSELDGPVNIAAPNPLTADERAISFDYSPSQCGGYIFVGATLASPFHHARATQASPLRMQNCSLLTVKGYTRRALKIPYALPTTRWQLEIGAFAGRTETELLLKSRRVVPARLLDAGFTFDYPDWQSAARAIVEKR